MQVRNVMGLTRIRNEATILKETLDHFAAYCDAGIIVYDDCSTDGTVKIAQEHLAVVRVIRGTDWSTDRMEEEWKHRQTLLEEGRRWNPDWLLYFDADERLDFDMKVPRGFDAIAMKLYDAYITAEDMNGIEVKDIGTRRRWFGPEFRHIVMLYRNDPAKRYFMPDQRIVAGIDRCHFAGYVRHYGKAVSVREWEETCDYYIKWWAALYAEKWAARKGKAVHTESDQGRPLIEWEDREEKGVCIGNLPHYAYART